MAKVNKSQLATALLAMYQSTYDFNLIAGKSVSQDYSLSQEAITVEEIKESIVAAILKDNKEKIDGLIDIIVTCSFLVMIKDSQTEGLTGTDLLKDHTETFDSVTSEESLWGQLLTATLKEKWIDVLTIAEDLLYKIDPEALYNLQEVANSNMSKFVPVNELSSPEDVCELIESKGRYTGVEYSTGEDNEGNKYYVFTATYDTKEKRAFDKPKIVKPEGYFKEPVLKV